MEQLFEIVQSRELRVDREQGVIHGVRILGPNSLNGRRYLAEAVRRAVPLYEGRAVNLNHPRNGENERSIADRFGWLRNVKEQDGGLNGDLHYLKTHPLAESVAEAAERNPRLFGMSHNAEGKTRREDGSTIVEEITRVRSVDLVSDPATTLSLFESQTQGENPMKKLSIRKILEAVFKKSKATVLEQMEADGMMPPEETAVEMPAEASSDEQVKAAFRQMVVAAFDDESLDMQGTLAKIKEILKAYDKLTTDESSASDSASSDDAPASEGLKAIRGALEEQQKSFRQELKQIRELLAERPMSGTRGVEKTLEGRTDPVEVPTGKDFLHAITR